LLVVVEDANGQQWTAEGLRQASEKHAAKASEALKALKARFNV
jgi:hypothetical protein